MDVVPRFRIALGQAIGHSDAFRVFPILTSNMRVATGCHHYYTIRCSQKSWKATGWQYGSCESYMKQLQRNHGDKLWVALSH